MEKFKVLSKGLLEAEKPSELEVIQLPEIVRLKEVPQDKQHHPEGNAWIHTMQVVDRAAELKNRSWMTDKEKLVYMLGTLLHDVGKYDCTYYRGANRNRLTHWTKPQPKGTRIVSYGHDKAGVKVVKEIFSRLAPDEIELQREVSKLVWFHMRPLLLKASKLKAFKKIKEDGGDLYLIGMLSWADKGERPNYWFRRIEELNEKEKRTRQ
jgi:hypothetical protein